MAKEYFEKLNNLISKTKIANEVNVDLEVKHFFSGAALYADGKICVSWFPAGIAFKMSETDAQKLIQSGQAIPLIYFPKGHTKKGYAVFEHPDSIPPSQWKNRILKAIKQIHGAATT